ncbi:MAG: oxidoreductase [Sphingobium sp.]|uniref:SDR family oxidoreductase n=1 Tax=Sphingobium sp. TaxID=1912891 RepID=UPI000DB87EAA|nr:SDR family oxidoreductase [Sphingobium sp.]PZU12387.1 MAG: oxidoreductase [Sphingobium sp.]
MTGRRQRLLVTGAASGIGAALRTQLLEQGHEVIGFDIHPADGILRCDLADDVSIVAATGRVQAPLDGIAHVAGLPGTAPPRRIAAVNLLAVRRLTGLLLPLCTQAASISIVSSVTAHRCHWSDERSDAILAGSDQSILDLFADLEGPEAYAASKRLVNRWASLAAAQLLPKAIRVNAVSPGPVETPILKDFEESMGASRIQAAAGIVGRHGYPEEIAATLAFLLSPASSWVNGVNIACDGGFSNARAMAPAPHAPSVLTISSEGGSCN